MAVIVIKHRSNIKRLMSGTEKTIVAGRKVRP
jgi:glycerol-3-phosphate acyltransferase PlsY